MSSPARLVPCNGCTACCERDLIVLHPDEGDDVRTFDAVPIIHPLTGAPVFALRRSASGACVYLEPGKGCSIHERRPVICRTFDCRRMVQQFSRSQRRAMIRNGAGDRRVFQAGFDRLSTLEDAR